MRGGPGNNTNYSVSYSKNWSTRPPGRQRYNLIRQGSHSARAAARRSQWMQVTSHPIYGLVVNVYSCDCHKAWIQAKGNRKSLLESNWIQTLRRYRTWTLKIGRFPVTFVVILRMEITPKWSKWVPKYSQIDFGSINNSHSAT